MYAVKQYPRIRKSFAFLAIILLIAGYALAGAHAAAAPEGKTQWTTYKNERCGYEIKYPSGWQAIEAVPKTGTGTFIAHEVLWEEELQKVTFLEKEYSMWPGEFQVRVLANPGSYSIEEWVKHHPIEDVSGGNLIQEQTDATLDGKAALRLSIFGFDHEQLALIAAGNEKEILDLSFAGRNPNDPDVERHTELYKEMVAGFRFIEEPIPPK